MVLSKYFCKILYKLWSCQNVCDALSYVLNNIYITFGHKLYRQIYGFPIGTICGPLVADLFLFCYERDFTNFLSDDNQVDIIEAFNSTSRYLNDLLNIDNPNFKGMVNQIRLKYSIGDTKVIWQMNTMFSTCNTCGMYTAHNKHDELNDKGI